MQIKQLLNEGKRKLIENNIEDACIQTRTLMQFILDKEQVYLIANGEKELDNEQEEAFNKGVFKIISGVPIQYITNSQEFMKLKFYVDENVLIPQPDTETIVEKIIKDYEGKKVKILDLCTGSGAIGISLAKYIEESEVTALDISMKALQIAKLNAEKNLVHKKMKFILSDMFEKIENEKFDIIVSNPPYIESDTIKTLEKQVQNEPSIALDGGKDGLKFYKIIADYAWKYLNVNGKIYLEIGYNQKEKVIKLLENNTNYNDIICIRDLAGNDRMIIAKMR